MSKVSKQKSAVRAPDNAVSSGKPDGIPMRYLVIGTAVLCVLCTIIFDVTEAINAMPMTIIGLVLVAFVCCALWYSGKLTVSSFIFLLFVAGFIIRLNYVLYTPLTLTSRIRQHDVYEFGSGKGHSGYIEYFYENGFSLKDADPTTIAQFYHPPLHHFLAAMWMRLLTAFGMSYERAVSSIQFLTLFYSACCMFVSERVLRKLNLKKAGLVLGTAIIAFHPIFIMLGGSINNDMLSVLFIFLAVYTTICWYQKPTLRNIIPIALSIGLGMMTKISVALVAIPVAFIFIVKFFSTRKEKLAYFKQYVIFGIICVPLGLWYGIRNYVKYDVSFTYVPRLSDTSDQYLGDYSVFERLFSMKDNPFENVFLNRISTGSNFYEYNPFVAIIKTSLFGEYDFSDTVESITPYCRILLIINIVLILLSLFATVLYIIKRNNSLDRNMKIFFGGYYVIMVVQFVIFCFNYPHNCSMDFRYIVPTLLIGSLFLGIMLDDFQELKSNNKAEAVLYYSTCGVIALFCLFSAIVYIMLGSAV